MDGCLEVVPAEVAPAFEDRTLTVEECTADGQLEDLGSDWSRLWEECPRATPFQSPEWLVPWWKHLGEGELWILAIRQQDQLVGLAPLHIHQNPDTKERTVLFLGTGITDYLDALLLPEFETEATAAILAHLAANQHRWDHCDFQQLSEGSPLLQATGAVDWTSEIAVQEVCPVLRLPSRSQELPALVPTRMLDKLKYYRRRLAKTAPVRVESVQGENFDQFFGDFIRLHQARWGTKGQKGALRLYALTFQGHISATLYGFSHAARTFYYLSGFEPGMAEFSPGTVLIGYAIEQAIEEGAGEFDFLRGREAYKYLWGAKGRLNYRRQFWHAEAA